MFKMQERIIQFKIKLLKRAFELYETVRKIKNLREIESPELWLQQKNTMSIVWLDYKKNLLEQEYEKELIEILSHNKVAEYMNFMYETYGKLDNYIIEKILQSKNMADLKAQHKELLVETNKSSTLCISEVKESDKKLKHKKRKQKINKTISNTKDIINQPILDKEPILAELKPKLEPTVELSSSNSHVNNTTLDIVSDPIQNELRSAGSNKPLTILPPPFQNHVQNNVPFQSQMQHRVPFQQRVQNVVPYPNKWKRPPLHSHMQNIVPLQPFKTEYHMNDDNKVFDTVTQPEPESDPLQKYRKYPIQDKSTVVGYSEVSEPDPLQKYRRYPIQEKSTFAEYSEVSEPIKNYNPYLNYNPYSNYNPYLAQTRLFGFS
jgi:hypothetical protein